MAGSQINSYAIGDVNLTSVMTTLDATRIGFCAVSLTNYATTGVPAIAAGSKIEVDGALFKFDAEEAIGGSPSNGTVYIKLIPAGTSITAEFTNTAPTWSTEKQGWYSPTAGEESYRYLPFGMTKSGSSYSSKYEMVVPAVAGVRAHADGAFSVTGDVNITGNMPKINSYATGFFTIATHSHRSTGGSYSAAFTITKPIMCALDMTYANAPGDSAVGLYIYSNGSWRRVTGSGTAEKQTTVALNPGYYCLYAYWFADAALYCLGAFGVTPSNFNLTSITT